MTCCSLTLRPSARPILSFAAYAGVATPLLTAQGYRRSALESLLERSNTSKFCEEVALRATSWNDFSCKEALDLVARANQENRVCWSHWIYSLNAIVDVILKMKEEAPNPPGSVIIDVPSQRPMFPKKRVLFSTEPETDEARGESRWVEVRVVATWSDIQKVFGEEDPWVEIAEEIHEKWKQDPDSRPDCSSALPPDQQAMFEFRFRRRAVGKRDDRHKTKRRMRLRGTRVPVSL